MHHSTRCSFVFFTRPPDSAATLPPREPPYHFYLTLSSNRRFSYCVPILPSLRPNFFNFLSFPWFPCAPLLATRIDWNFGIGSCKDILSSLFIFSIPGASIFHGLLSSYIHWPFFILKGFGVCLFFLFSALCFDTSCFLFLHLQPRNISHLIPSFVLGGYSSICFIIFPFSLHLPHPVNISLTPRPSVSPFF